MAEGSAPVTGASGHAELEKLESDKHRLEEELKYVQLQMTDTLNLNDGLLAELRQKDETLVKREGYYSIISEKNAAELQQLEVEAVCSEQKYTYDVDSLQAQVDRMQLRRERYLRLKKENDNLNDTFEDMQRSVAEMSLDHANLVHDMNKDMMMVRENLESKLRQELNAMDLKYQQHAFSSLNETDKRDIFENAKLKDEVTLQSIGIANLSLRLGKQKHGTSGCNTEISKLNKKAALLRDQLSDLQSTKFHRTKEIDRLTKEIETLRLKKDSLEDLLHKDLDLDTLSDNIDECMRKIKYERLSAELWQKRLESAHFMQDYMIPTSDGEKKGTFSSNTHKLVSTTSSLTGLLRQESKRDNNLPSEDGSSSSGDGAKLADIAAAMSKDPSMNLALRSLVGKESVLVGGKSRKKGKGENQAEEAQNMAAWVICEVMKDWMTSKKELQASFDALESESIIANSTLPGVMLPDYSAAAGTANGPTTESKSDVYEDEGRIDPAERDDMWDELFASDNSEEESSWYKLRDSAKRIPEGIKVGMPTLNERFNFDAIRPANITYDLDPPINKSGVSQSMDNLALKNQLILEMSTDIIKAYATKAPAGGAAVPKKVDGLKGGTYQNTIYSGSGLPMTKLSKAHSVSALNKKRPVKQTRNAASTQKL
jgi:hypothetical protein